MNRLLALAGGLLAAGCGSASGGPSIPTSLPGTAAPYLGASGPNVLPILVGGTSLCGTSGGPNVLCTSVTICVPGTAQCQTVGDILVDSGSVGLRVFSSVVTLAFPPQGAPDGRPLAECATFGTGSDWGPIAQAAIQLGGEPTVLTPIQLIDPGYASVPSPCAQSDTTPANAGFNGILGVGLFAQDCGSLCATDPTSQTYYSCPTSGPGSCTAITLTVEQQLQSPISLLPVDGNGSLIALTGVSPGGGSQATGALILGIGTQANNSPQGVSPFATDAAGGYQITLNGQTYPGSFVDSGSNGLYFPDDAGLPVCAAGSPTAGFYCPGSAVSFNAVTLAADGSNQALVPFQVTDANTLLASGFLAFNDLAGTSSGGFDLGLPFFYGRAIFTGLENTSSPLGIGPLWAY